MHAIQAKTTKGGYRSLHREPSCRPRIISSRLLESLSSFRNARENDDSINCQLHVIVEPN